MIITDQANSTPMPLDGYLFQNTFGVSGITTLTPTGAINSLSSCAGSCACDSCSISNLVLAESIKVNSSGFLWLIQERLIFGFKKMGLI